MVDAPLAILGATSKIALDFLARTQGEVEAHLYARDPAAAMDALGGRKIAIRSEVRPLSRFGERRYGGIVNFIGIGDPSKTIAMGAAIFDATALWDGRVLAHLEGRPDIPYIFLSSGAVYGDAFETPVTAASRASIPINDLGPQSWYGLAKLTAEARHRASPGRTIIDIRVFNYISRTLDTAARFLVSDMIRAIQAREVFETSDVPIVRDYLHPADFAALVRCALGAPRGTNMAVDAYTRAPIAKSELLDLTTDHFGLRYRIVPRPDIVNATGIKPNYYSLNRAAAALGFEPTRTSAAALVEELTPILGYPANREALSPRVSA